METEMKLEHLTSAAMMVASWLLAGSCAFDEREVSLAIPGLGIGGGPAGGVGGLPATPQLAVATLEVRSDVGGQAQVALNGLGLAAGDLILAPVAGSFEDFGSARLGSTLEESFSISNPTDVASGPLRFRVNRPEFVLLAPGEGDCIPDVTSLVHVFCR
jgi:hypothetical protein